MRISICMATYDRPNVLRRTLRSIYDQDVDWDDCEVVVVDDGGPSSSADLADEFPIVYQRVVRDPGYRNPAIARNIAYRLAKGDVIIAQSDDVMHQPGAIRALTDDLGEGEFLIATVWNVNEDGDHVGLDRWPHIKQITGPLNQRPLFFLGSVRRSDLYAVGGCDEDFLGPGKDDVWLADCLINGRLLRPRYIAVEGYHQDHPRPDSIVRAYQNNARLYRQRVGEAVAGVRPWQGGLPGPRDRLLPPSRPAASLPATAGRVGRPQSPILGPYGPVSGPQARPAIRDTPAAPDGTTGAPGTTRQVVI